MVWKHNLHYSNKLNHKQKADMYMDTNRDYMYLTDQLTH